MPQHRGSFKNSREARRTASPDRITIFTQPEPNSKAKAPMHWHNPQKRQVFTMVIRWFCHTEGPGELIVPTFLLPFLWSWKILQNSFLFANITSLLSCRASLLPRVTPQCWLPPEQVSIPALPRHHLANEVMSRSRPWKILLLSSLDSQTYRLTACICRQMDTTLQALGGLVTMPTVCGTLGEIQPLWWSQLQYPVVIAYRFTTVQDRDKR